MTKPTPHDYPFGSLISNRSWSDASREYRFGFNSQEMDNEVAGTGNSYTAEFWQYDGRLGRRFNLDPILKSSASNYACFSNIPSVNVDPNGALDYYNKRGKWLGTDGVDDNKKAVAFSWKVKREIKKNTRNGEYTGSIGLIGNGVVYLPDVSTKNAMNNSLANTRTDTKRYSSSDADAHEEGGFTDNTGPHEAEPGKGIGHDLTLPPGAAVGIDFANSKDGTIFNPSTVKFIWHTHPMGTESVQVDTENPSNLLDGTGDIQIARSYPNATHILISSYSENVIFYNGKGIYLIMKIRTFNAVIDDKNNSRKEKFEKKRNEIQKQKNSIIINPVQIECAY